MEKKTITHTDIQPANLQSVSSEPVLDIYGCKSWHNESGLLHREGEPAVEWANGDKEWYRNGQLHRALGPAIKKANGTKMWYLNGQRHREDDPAIEWANGTKIWYLNGQLHRENGPAKEYANGTRKWYFDGQFLHKKSPVFKWSDKNKHWCFSELVELLYTEIELEFLPEIFEDTQTLSFQDGGTVYDQDGWLHLEGAFKGHELESLLTVIVPCIKTPVQLILTNPEGQEEQTLTMDKNGVYDQSGREIALDPDNCA
jgi:hypothetical protein